MQLLYPLGTGSKWGDNELRYSLRSAHRHTPVTNVVVVGHRPHWLQCTHVPAVDLSSDKVGNVLHKLRTALRSGLLHEEFVLMNDDFLFRQKMASVPVLVRGSLADRLRTMPGNSYYKPLHERALIELRAMGMAEPMDFGVHAPMPLRRTEVERTLRTFAHLPHYPFRTMHGNLHGLRGELVADPKMYVWRTPEPAPFLSYDDGMAGDPAFRAWVRKELPTPSPWEA